MYILFVVRYMRIVYKLAPFFFMGRNADGGGGGKTSRANWTWGETSRIRRNDQSSTEILRYLTYMGCLKIQAGILAKNCLLLYLHRSYKK